MSTIPDILYRILQSRLQYATTPSTKHTRAIMNDMTMSAWVADT